MSLQNHLLTDEQMRQFISHGYLILKTDFSAEFHTQLNARLDEVMNKEGNPGNNILPRLSEVNDVFQSPVIQGALTSVVGPGYVMHPHRHCHYTFPGRKVQGWHKDSYWGHQKIRNHHNWWVMIFYYPHAVDEEMGPSGIFPGTQYYTKRAGDETEQPVFMEGGPGTFALIHYDLWHRGGANNSQKNRAMMKFQFARMEAPTASAWNNRSSDWRAMNGDAPPTVHEALWRSQWRWHLGQPGARDRDAVEENIPELAAQLGSEYEPTGVDAAYRLASQGRKAVGALAGALTSDDATAARNAGYGLTSVGPTALGELTDALGHPNETARMYAAFALGEIGAEVMESSAAVAKLVDDPSVEVRRSAVEALGLLASPADATIPALVRGLYDEDGQVRFTSAQSLQRIGPDAAEAVPALSRSLRDENRYVRANAVDALRRIGTTEALTAALDHLSAHRWCPTTTPDDTF